MARVAMLGTMATAAATVANMEATVPVVPTMGIKAVVAVATSSEIGVVVPMAWLTPSQRQLENK